MSTTKNQGSKISSIKLVTNQKAEERDILTRVISESRGSR